LSAVFDPTKLGDAAIPRRLKVTSAAVLPAGWTSGRLPQPALPIDECVQILLRKRRIREAPELQALRRLGACPYAVARHGVVRAAAFAAREQEKQDRLKPVAIDALKYFKYEGPRLRTELHFAWVRAERLLDLTDQLDILDVDAAALSDATSSLRDLLNDARGGIASAHRELSKFGGNVWRLSFVRALFTEWWVLTGKDPKASPGPCQDFICAAWCSLSPLATPTDADWGSAIKVALTRCQPGQWRAVNP
jgi:hypothetical protein